MHTQAPLHLAQLSALSCRQRRLHDLTPLTLQILHSETSHNLTQQLSCTLFTKPHIAQTSATTIAPSQHSITAFLQRNLHFCLIGASTAAQSHHKRCAHHSHHSHIKNDKHFTSNSNLQCELKEHALTRNQRCIVMTN